MRGASGAGRGRVAAKAVSSTKSTMRSSGARATSSLSRTTAYARGNKGKVALMGGAAIGAMGLARTRRSGLNKGRSSMYRY